MEALNRWLDIPRDKVNWKHLLLLVLIAYAFSIAVRGIWYYQTQTYSDSMWNGEVMINTNDGYYYAEGARDILAGGNTPGDLSPVDNPLSELTAFLARILPVSFETLILWMPAFFGSLLVVPTLLIGRTLGHTQLGFFAALLAGIAWSYYNRTMTGYYDTDMLVVVFPALVLWGLIYALTYKRNRYLLITT